MDTLSLLLAGIGIALILEGIVYFVSPGGIRRYLLQLLEMRDGTLRLLGLLLMAAGLALAWFAVQ